MPSPQRSGHSPPKRGWLAVTLASQRYGSFHTGGLSCRECFQLDFIVTGHFFFNVVSDCMHTTLVVLILSTETVYDFVDVYCYKVVLSKALFDAVQYFVEVAYNIKGIFYDI